MTTATALPTETRQEIIDALVAQHVKPVHARIIALRGEGKSVRETALAVGRSERSVKYVTSAHRDAVEAIQWIVRRQIAEMTAERLQEVVTARLDDAANNESRTGAQSFVAVLKAFGVVDDKSSVHIGDVNVGTVNISEDRRQIVLQGDSPELKALREKYGLERQ